MFNEFLLIKFNFKNKWIQKIDISDIIFSKFPSFCDLRNGYVILSGGISLTNNEYVNDAVLYDTRDYNIEKLSNMNISRYKHQSIECKGSVYVIGGLHNKN